MSPLISIDVEEGVTREDEASAMGAVRDTDALAVSGYQKIADETRTISTWQPWKTFLAWVSTSALRAYGKGPSLLKNSDNF